MHKKQAKNIMIFKKHLKIELSENLQLMEYQCRCKYSSCYQTLISQELIDAFESFRVSCGSKPLHVLSGYRCHKHNSEVGGMATSRHLLGLASDIAKPKSMSIEEFSYRAKEFFDVVIPYVQNNFIHCHINP